MSLRNSKIFNSKYDKNSHYGTIDKNNPRAFFFEFKLSVYSLIDDDKINKIINNNQNIIKNKLKEEINKRYFDLFFNEYIILIIDLKNSTLKKDKVYNLDIEITVKAKTNIFKKDNYENKLSEINSNFKEIIVNNLNYLKVI